MSWQDTMLTMLRVTIGDFNGSEFADCRLEDILLVAAQYVAQEIEFDVDYVISFSDKDIEPDPTDDPQDNPYVNLVVLKAACLIDQGNMRVAALKNGLSARLGPLAMTTGGHLDGFKMLIEQGYCKTYAEAKKQFQFGNPSWVTGILSPFANVNFIPSEDAPLTHEANNELRYWR